MFESLKKKLSGWFKKEPEKEVLKKKTKKDRKLSKKITKKEKKLISKRVEEKLKEKAEKISEEVPLKFNAGKQKYEPDLEAIEVAIEEKKATEKKKEEHIQELGEEIKGEGFFAKLKKKISASVLKQEEFEEIFEEFEIVLLENNVALEVVDKIKGELVNDLVGISVKKGEEEATIKDSLRKAIESVLVEGDDLIERIEKSF